MLATTPSLKYEYLLSLWKTRHEKYLRQAKEKIQKSKQKYKEKQDSKIVIPQHIFESGDLILIHNGSKQNKLSKEWNGPFSIVEKVNNSDYFVLVKRERYLTHANRLKAFYS